MAKTMQLCYEILHLKQQCERYLELKKVRDILLELLDLRSISKVMKNIKNAGLLTLVHQFNALHKDVQEPLIYMY